MLEFIFDCSLDLLWKYAFNPEARAIWPTLMRQPHPVSQWIYLVSPGILRYENHINVAILFLAYC